MRTLVLLRGAPGAGKSSFIRELGLEPFTLEADKFRQLVCNPEMQDTYFGISQKNDKLAWNMLFQCLEERMKRGDFTVIDATHATPNQCKKYKELADRYKYTIYYQQFDVDLDVLLKRNKYRGFKSVPNNVIERMHSLVSTVDLPKTFKRINDIEDITDYYTLCADDYREVKIIGDIHGCMTILEQAFPKLEDDVLYIFLGDYLDRGTRNYDTLKYIESIADKPNVILLEGNHESHGNWGAFAYKEDVKGQFKHTYKKLLAETDYTEETLRKTIKKIFKKLHQCVLLNFNGLDYIISHGGIPFVPIMLALRVSTETLVKGYGDYNCNVDRMFEDWLATSKKKYTQIHGHRHFENTIHSVSLESGVELGGNLLIATLDRNTTWDNPYTINAYKNNNFAVIEQTEYIPNDTYVEYTENTEINNLCNDKDIRVKELDHNLLSINFTPKAFWGRRWNMRTLKARGLFVDKTTGDVKMRSYEKFFNYGELTETSPLTLKESLVYPVILKAKANGFLGILGVIDNELVYASKSTTKGDYAEYFKEVVNKTISKKDLQELKDLLVKENATAVFEVIHHKDPHIVKYTKDNVVLLDIIPNKLHLSGIHVDKQFSIQCKDKLLGNIPMIEQSGITICNSEDDILDAMQVTDTLPNIEGFVATDQRGFMFKYKGKWYKEWKFRRRLLEEYVTTGKLCYEWTHQQSDIDFLNFLKKFTREELKGKSIINIRDAYLGDN